jgi:hypothetical protein
MLSCSCRAFTFCFMTSVCASDLPATTNQPPEQRMHTRLEPLLQQVFREMCNKPMPTGPDGAKSHPTDPSFHKKLQGGVTLPFAAHTVFARRCRAQF